MPPRAFHLSTAMLGAVLAIATTMTAFPAAASADPSSDLAVVTLNDGSSIGTLDTATGDTNAFSGPNHDELWGDAFSTNGNLYGLEAGQLVEVDQTTGASTAIGNNQGLTYGLDQAPDGTMYAESYGGSDGGGLYTVDTTTGATTFIGSNGGAMDVTFDCSGTLWGTDGGQLYSYDLATGAVTNTVAMAGSNDASMIMGLFTDANGDVLATTYDDPSELFKVDTTTGALTLIADTNASYAHGGDDADACANVAEPTTLGSVSGSANYGGAARLSATLTADGSGVSGESVDFSMNGTAVGTALTDSNGVATLDNVSTTGTDAGTYVNAVTATFAGDSAYESSDGAGDLSVSPDAQNVTFTSSANAATVGGTYTATATGGDSGNPVVFSADADTTNSACTVTDTGAVSFQHAGSCVVDAEQEGNTDYSAATTAQQAIPVGAAATATTIAVTSHEITATTTATNPAAGTPTGTVSFSVDGTTVGTAPLNAGVAELPYTVPAGSTRDVAAVYGGSADFTGSSASTNRTNPTIRAKVSSTRPKTRSGWYSRPVTVTFTCTDNAAQLASRCPAPVTLKHNGAGQSVTRTVTAMNGGAATVTVTNINIDRTKPSVHVSGVRKGGTYRGTAPHLNCVAKDNLSGVSSCTIRTTASLTGKTKYIATATNGAGLSAKSRGHYLQIPVWLQHTPWRNNAFQVRSGRTVTLRAASHSRPHYLWAAPVTAGRSTPHGGNTGFVPIGTHQWKLRVWLNKAMTKRYSLWNMGVRFGGKLHIVRIAFQQ